MKNYDEIVKAPIFFERNRVWRVYTGGKLFSNFFGDPDEDNSLPEEWVCSCVKAINKGSTNPYEGLSVVKGTDIHFDELINARRKEMIGDRKDLGVLVKMLDSAVRLPVQAHPDKAFSRKYFHSDYGKAESWVVIDTREDACIYYGFKDVVTKEEFKKAVLASETDKNAMPPFLNRIPVKKGDVYLICAKMVHAIGAGCLILETQEPTDFTIQPEAWCDTYHLDDKEMFIGLDIDTALDCFNYDIVGEDAIALGRKFPKTLREGDGVKYETLISYDDTPCFGVDRVTLSGGRIKDLPGCAIYVVTEGKGSIGCDGNTRLISKGDYFFAPYSIDGKFEIAGDMEFIICLPPKKA